MIETRIERGGEATVSVPGLPARKAKVDCYVRYVRNLVFGMRHRDGQ